MATRNSKERHCPPAHFSHLHWATSIAYELRMLQLSMTCTMLTLRVLCAQIRKGVSTDKFGTNRELGYRSLGHKLAHGQTSFVQVASGPIQILVHITSTCCTLIMPRSIAATWRCEALPKGSDLLLFTLCLNSSCANYIGHCVWQIKV